MYYQVAISDDGNYAVVSDTDDELYFSNPTGYDQAVPMWSRVFGQNIYKEKKIVISI